MIDSMALEVKSHDPALIQTVTADVKLQTWIKTVKIAPAWGNKYD